MYLYFWAGVWYEIFGRYLVMQNETWNWYVRSFPELEDCWINKANSAR